MRNKLFAVSSLVLLFSFTSNVQAQALPQPDSEEFCQVIQQILANTAMVSNNTVFDNMPDYRSSKPSVDPLNTYQIVTYDGAMPLVVSCKVKAADHIRLTYGEDKAGEQEFCPKVVRLIQAQAVMELSREGLAEASAKAKSFVVEDTELSITGSGYLSDFQPSYIAEDGRVHFISPGLHHDWDTWWGLIMPDKFIGQTYCHLPTVQYMKSIALGATEPGATLTTNEDAPTKPQG